MTILAAIRTLVLSTLRNWRLFAAVAIALGLALTTKSQSSVVRTVALGAVAISVGLNLFVILANGGRMPAKAYSVEIEHRDNYTLMNAETRFAYLGDWIQVREGLSAPISPGDVLLFTGLAAALADRLLGPLLM